MFHTLSSLIPPGENHRPRMLDDALSIIAAALATVKRTLDLATFYIVDDKEIHRRLKQELADAVPDPQNMPSYEYLRKLPYLTACVNEGLFYSEKKKKALLCWELTP